MFRPGKTGATGVVVGVGDDTAVVRPRAGEDLLITTDIQVEDRHFRRRWLTGFELGWRLAAVNLSDIAAMGGTPRYGVVSLAVPRDPASVTYIIDAERGVRDHLAKYGAAVVGGNVSGSDSGIVLDMTLVGAVARGKAWRRTCSPGRDAIVVVGYLGDARAGLDVLEAGRGLDRYKRLVRSFKRPRPLVDAARFLDRKAVRGAIDVSDGFSTDLIRLCEAAGAGCEVESGTLPISPSLARFCRARGVDPAEWALGGGEDYALILSVPARSANDTAVRLARRLRVPARVVGRFTRRKNRYDLLMDTGKRKPLKALGWDHLSGRR